MNPRLANRDRRALFAGLAVIAALVVGFRGGPAWVSWRSTERDFASVAIQNTRTVQAVIGEFPETVDSLEARTARFRSSANRVLVAATTNEATRALEAVVTSQARQAGVRVDGMRTRSQGGDSLYLVRVLIDAEAVGDVEGVTGWLGALETGSPYLAVRHLSVEPEAPDAGDDRAETLVVRLTVEARVWLREAGAASRLARR